ncbi:hypothetical protein [Deinococcus fonticola]|uniref:hypothetical protein n=1 Tax=Deinococcus fonticola TaxID=2528713 RepID=UPI001075039C|nr:hypothetical protein [Deinococcus fonticola]
MSGEILNAIRLAARDQLSVPAARAQLRARQDLIPAGPGADTYRHAASVRYRSALLKSKLTGEDLTAALDRVILALLEEHQRSGVVEVVRGVDGRVRTVPLSAETISLRARFSVPETQEILRRLRRDGRAEWCSVRGWRLKDQPLTVTVAEALGVAE